VEKKNEILTSDHLTERDWDLLFVNAQTQLFLKGNSIVEQGVKNLYLYRIQSGSVLIIKNHQEGQKVFHISNNL
jgi:hypothetical protein